MDSGLRVNMLRYYDERAPEYEQAYTAGTGTSSITSGEVFVREAAMLEAVVERLAGGRRIDLACGTEYWRGVGGIQDVAAAGSRQPAANVVRSARGKASRCHP